MATMSMRKIYRKIARQYGTTAAEVRREIQCVIDDAYRNAPDDGITKAYQNRVPRKGEIPTPEEFIRYCSQQLRGQKSQSCGK